jgi:hypothetical protein
MSVNVETLPPLANQPPAWSEAGETLAWRRAFVRLPLEERRRLMAAQATRALDDYVAEAATREDWQGGDIVEY